MQKKILVTGANGQLGMELQQLAPAYPGFQFIFTTRNELPLDDPDAIIASIAFHQPHYVINCGAYTAVDKAESEKELAYKINAEGPGVLAASCAAAGIPLIHISTDYVFNGKAVKPIREDDPTEPVNLYGASKLEGEKNVLREHPSAIIIRTAWVYSSFGKNFVKTMLRLMSEKEEIGVVNDQYGTPTYAADLADAILKIIVSLDTKKAGQPGIYHYSNEGQISWYDFAVAIAAISNSKCRVKPITTAQFPTPAKRPAYSVLDKSKIKQVFGIEPPDWRTSLGKCIRKIQSE
jgi:dTDP-4-dehydrorhamnose reductase